MVKRLLSYPAGLCLLIVLMVLMVSPAFAKGLVVEPDRTQLYDGEVFTLTVKGTMELDISLSNLFSFDLSDLPAPDIEKVEPDFRILARNQRYSVHTVNNETVGEITWTYQLAPNRSGSLTIPSLTFRDTHSSPVTIEVIDGAPPGQKSTNRYSFIELAADKDEVYVQEQLVLTVQLYFSGNLIRGELSEPEHPNAIIEPLGKQREFSRFRNGTRYRVVERRYGIFPQQPGELTLPPIRFEGQARDASGQLRFLRDKQQLFDVNVKPVPAGFPAGHTWLPASKLTLTEEGLPATRELANGTNLNRRITLQAAGLPAETLAPLNIRVPDTIRSYPESPLRNTETRPDGLQGTLQQSFALVPVQPGNVSLPAVRLPWWNTEADQLEYARLPGHSYLITGGNQATRVPDTPEALSGDGDGTEAAKEKQQSPAPSDISPWLVSTIILAGLWLATLVLWWLSRRRKRRQTRPGRQPEGLEERQAFCALKQSIQAHSPAMPTHLVSWARLFFTSQQFTSAQDVARFCAHNELDNALRDFQAALYSKENTNRGAATSDLIQALEQIRKGPRKAPETAGNLPSLYPAELSY